MANILELASRPGTEKTVARGTKTSLLIMNADDWGRDERTTDRTLDCFTRGALSSVSAMVFMRDSERAAAMARDRSIDTGLHLNFTAPFTGSGIPSKLLSQQARIASYLLASRFAPVIFNPALVKAFNYVASAQYDEYTRLYGAAPRRVDGHHHMHLCANVLLQRLLPISTVVRRNFSFERGEKNLANRTYRCLVDQQLERRHKLTDYFYSLPPLESSRLDKIFASCTGSTIEMETHPIQEAEYCFLTEGALSDRLADHVVLATNYLI
jgi:predicted glycoside hydrolase/deacetylase ChbG (UPF0249 family)